MSTPATAAATVPKEEQSSITSNSAQINQQTIQHRDNEEYKIVKKLPKRFPKRVNDIYITTKTDFRAQLKRCEQLLTIKSKENEIYLHAMGGAINRAISLALQIQTITQCSIDTQTSTVELEDDLMPLVDSLDISTQHRYVSSIHIKLKLNT